MSASTFFEWNMDRAIINLFGPFSLRWYSLFFLGGILVGNYIFHQFLVKENKPTHLRDTLLYYIVLGTIVGARLGHCLFYDPDYYLSHPLTILKIWEGGLASHGGFTGVILACLIFSLKYRQMPFFWLMDRIGIVAILAGAFIRLGNFFNSEIIGKVSEVPWAIIFTQVDSLPRHPTQLYEALGYFTISLFLYGLYRRSGRKPLEGRIFGFGLTLAYLFRFLIEQLKENQVAYEDHMLFNMGQILSLPFIVLGLCLIAGVQHKIPWLRWGFAEAKASATAKPSRKQRRPQT